MSEELLKIEGLKKSFGKLEVLKGLTTTIKKGEVVVMIGPSGGGKSTFLRCMNLLEQPTEGRIVFDDIDIVSADEKTKNKVRSEMGMSVSPLYRAIYPYTLYYIRYYFQRKSGTFSGGFLCFPHEKKTSSSQTGDNVLICIGVTAKFS